jgi:hypothetical protein
MIGYTQIHITQLVDDPVLSVPVMPPTKKSQWLMACAVVSVCRKSAQRFIATNHTQVSTPACFSATAGQSANVSHPKQYK